MQAFKLFFAANRADCLSGNLSKYRESQTHWFHRSKFAYISLSLFLFYHIFLFNNAILTCCLYNILPSPLRKEKRCIILRQNRHVPPPAPQLEPLCLYSFFYTPCRIGRKPGFLIHIVAFHRFYQTYRPNRDQVVLLPAYRVVFFHNMCH